MSGDLPPPVDDVAGAFVTTVLGEFARRPGPRFTLMLSGGPTAGQCYRALAAATGAGEPSGFDWSVVDVFMGDERLVPPDDSDANQRLVRESLQPTFAGVGSFNPMPTLGPVAQCVAGYQSTMETVLAGAGLDLVHLGLGPDGHTASLFPHSPALEAGPAELVVATTDPDGRNPHPRLSVTLPVINSARCAVFTVAGESKRQAVEALRRGEDIPAARVHPARLVWLIDRAAAGPCGPEG